MNNFRNTHITPMMVYEDPQDTANSPADLALPITVTKAVFDAETGESLADILDRLQQGPDAPTAPPSITVPSDAQADSTITISWTAATDPQNQPLTYRLERRIDAGGWTLVAENLTVLTTTDDLPSGPASVTYRVRAHNPQAYGAWAISTAVTVAQPAQTGVPLRDLPAGTRVQLRQHVGAWVDYFVLHQGNPSAAYQGFQNSTILMSRDAIVRMRVGSPPPPQHSNDPLLGLMRPMDQLFDEDTHGMLSEYVHNNVRQVRIPFRPGAGSGTAINSGAQGHPTRAFTLSMAEVGLPAGTFPHMPNNEGVKFDYFLAGTGDEANARRMFPLGDVRLRTPMTDGTQNSWILTGQGAATSSANAYPGTHYVQAPFVFALNDTAMATPDGANGIRLTDENTPDGDVIEMIVENGNEN